MARDYQKENQTPEARARRRRYNESPKGQAANRKGQDNYKKKYPKRVAAQQKVRHSHGSASGHRCRVCGRPATAKHHTNYGGDGGSVEWLCHAHHVARHHDTNMTKKSARFVVLEKGGKVSKDEATYMTSPSEEYQRCRSCKYFSAPSDCHLVEGSIAPSATCYLWTSKTGQKPTIRGKVYSIDEGKVVAKSHKDKLPGGLADKKKPTDFPADALAQGVKVELEHTKDRKLAQEIAMDHLTEDEKYYKKLETVEKDMKEFRPRFRAKKLVPKRSPSVTRQLQDAGAARNIHTPGRNPAHDERKRQGKINEDAPKKEKPAIVRQYKREPDLRGYYETRSPTDRQMAEAKKHPKGVAHTRVAKLKQERAAATKSEVEKALRKAADDLETELTKGPGISMMASENDCAEGVKLKPGEEKLQKPKKLEKQVKDTGRDPVKPAAAAPPAKPATGSSVLSNLKEFVTSPVQSMKEAGAFGARAQAAARATSRAAPAPAASQAGTPGRAGQPKLGVVPGKPTPPAAPAPAPRRARRASKPKIEMLKPLPAAEPRPDITDFPSRGPLPGTPKPGTPMSPQARAAGAARAKQAGRSVASVTRTPIPRKPDYEKSVTFVAKAEGVKNDEERKRVGRHEVFTTPMQVVAGKDTGTDVPKPPGYRRRDPGEQAQRAHHKETKQRAAQGLGPTAEAKRAAVHPDVRAKFDKLRAQDAQAKPAAKPAPKETRIKPVVITPPKPKKPAQRAEEFDPIHIRGKAPPPARPQTLQFGRRFDKGSSVLPEGLSSQAKEILGEDGSVKRHKPKFTATKYKEQRHEKFEPVQIQAKQPEMRVKTTTITASPPRRKPLVKKAETGTPPKPTAPSGTTGTPAAIKPPSGEVMQGRPMTMPGLPPAKTATATPKLRVKTSTTPKGKTTFSTYRGPGAKSPHKTPRFGNLFGAKPPVKKSEDETDLGKGETIPMVGGVGAGMMKTKDGKEANVSEKTQKSYNSLQEGELTSGDLGNFKNDPPNTGGGSGGQEFSSDSKVGMPGADPGQSQTWSDDDQDVGGQMSDHKKPLEANAGKKGTSERPDLERGANQVMDHYGMKKAMPDVHSDDAIRTQNASHEAYRRLRYDQNGGPDLVKGLGVASQPTEEEVEKSQAHTWHQGRVLYTDGEDQYIEKAQNARGEITPEPTLGIPHSPLTSTKGCGLCKSAMPAYLTTCPSCGVAEGVGAHVGSGHVVLEKAVADSIRPQAQHDLYLPFGTQNVDSE